VSDRIRRAQASDARALRALTRRSMAHWPHDAAYLAEANRLMSLSGKDLEHDEAWVLEQDGRPTGYYRLSIEADVAEIEELMVEPAWIGQGMGRRLFEHAADAARRLGCARMEWDTDENPAGFYGAMGGKMIGTRPSGIEGEAPLTRMRLDL
jgi:GNAT superfamily N-acetyltransferase